MKRGLKLRIPLRTRGTGGVKEGSPMKRGLKSSSPHNLLGS